MFSAISQKTGLSNVTPILGTSDNGNGTNLAIIGFNSEPDKKAVSTAASFANSSYRLFSTEMNNLNKRMGDIRDSGEAGVWGRYMLGQGSGTDGYQNTYNHLQLGADKGIRIESAMLYTGLIFTHTSTNAELSGSYYSDTKSYGLGGVRVSRSSTINVKHVVYSVPSRLVGQLLRVRLWDDRLSCYVGSSEVMSCPRVRPEKGKTRARRIDFRHVIDSLAKKPGAFCHATLRNDILPDDEWRRLWRRLCNHLEPDMAGRLMVHALKLAAGYDDISVVAKGMEQMLNTPGNVDLHRLMRFLGIKEKALPVVNVKQHNLSSYEQLLRGKGGSQ